MTEKPVKMPPFHLVVGLSDGCRLEGDVVAISETNAVYGPNAVLTLPDGKKINVPGANVPKEYFPEHSQEAVWAQRSSG